MVGVAWVGLFAPEGGWTRELTTGLAERDVVILEDGSRMELNARTVVGVKFGLADRRVTLTRGEALFTVAKDASRPFVVETAAGVVRAAGTVFNVRATDAGGRVEVTVLEGSVRLGLKNNATDEAALSPGTQAWLGGGGAVSVRVLPEGGAQDAGAWRSGQVVFHDTPLGEALERFAAYHPKTIVVEADAAELRLGGRFALNDLNGLLDAVQRVLPVRIGWEPDGVVRIKASAR